MNKTNWKKKNNPDDLYESNKKNQESKPMNFEKSRRMRVAERSDEGAMEQPEKRWLN